MRAIPRLRCVRFVAPSMVVLALVVGAGTARAYLGVGWIHNEVKGEFTDELVLSGADAVYDVPRVDPGDGLRYVLGGGGDAVAFELSYALSRHRAPGVLRPDGYPTKYHLVGVDMLIGTRIGRSLTAGRGEIYARLGVAGAWLRLDGSGYDSSPVPFDVQYNGGSFTLGSGFVLRASPMLHPYVEWDYRFTGFNSVNSRGKDIELDERLGGSGPSIMAGLNLRIPRR